MARDMKQVIENTRNQPKPLKRWARRQHDAKGVSNFHLDRDDQIVRTNSGHPRCNYCFIASHPRMNCKFRKHDLRNNVDRAVHPQKGLLSYKDFKKQFKPEIPITTLGHLLSSLNLSMVGNNNHHNYLLRYETIKKIVDRLPCLKNIILTGTNLCRK